MCGGFFQEAQRLGTTLTLASKDNQRAKFRHYVLVLPYSLEGRPGICSRKRINTL